MWYIKWGYAIFSQLDKQGVTDSNPMPSSQVGKIIDFLIFSPPLMLNNYHKSLFYVAEIQAWREGGMIIPHYFQRRITAHKPVSHQDLFPTSANEQICCVQQISQYCKLNQLGLLSCWGGARRTIRWFCDYHIHLFGRYS